eukprot:COSAG02_NODE_14729_length_1242_cov_1.845144_1_plen_223_part_01
MSRPSSRGGRPGSASRPGTDPGLAAGVDGFLPPIAAKEPSVPVPPRSGPGGGSRPGSARRHTTVLRENNWMITSEMPRSPEHGNTGDVGTYLRQLAAEDSEELMRELTDALSEVRDLNAKNSELTKANAELQSVGDTRLSELDACSKRLDESRLKVDELERNLRLTQEKLSRTESEKHKLAGTDGGRSQPSSPVDEQETDQLRVRIKSLEAQLVQTDNSWKTL